MFTEDNLPVNVVGLFVVGEQNAAIQSQIKVDVQIALTTINNLILDIYYVVRN